MRRIDPTTSYLTLVKAKENIMDKKNDFKRNDDLALESDIASMHPLISWRSVIAGTLIAFFSMIGLLGLGMALWWNWNGW